jgi:hypothetical protein
MAFACVPTECVKVASFPHMGVFAISKVRCGAQAIQGPAHGWVDSVTCFTEADLGEVCSCPCRQILLGVMGRTHKSVLGSLYPVKITLPPYITKHAVFVKITIQPALHSMQMVTSNATV